MESRSPRKRSFDAAGDALRGVVGAALPLWAQANFWEDVARNFRQGSASAATQQIYWYVTLAAAAIVLIAVAYFSLVRFVGRPGHSPTRLFWELCRAHRLGWRDRWLLWRLARSGPLRHPARIFLEPELWRRMGLPHDLRLHAAAIRRLERMLFAGAGTIEPAALAEGIGQGGGAGLAEGSLTASGAALSDGAVKSPQTSHLSGTSAEEPGDAILPPHPLLPAGARPTLDIPPWTASPMSDVS